MCPFIPPSAIIVTQPLDRGIHKLLNKLDSRLRGNDSFFRKPYFMDRLYLSKADISFFIPLFSLSFRKCIY